MRLDNAHGEIIRLEREAANITANMQAHIELYHARPADGGGSSSEADK